MNINAASLHKKANTGQVREEVTNILKTLEVAITTAHEERRSSITHELPFNFAISNMTLKDAQRVIYCNVIEELEKNGFKVRIRINQSAAFIIVGWVSVFDKAEMQRMSDVIARHHVAAPHNTSKQE